MAIQGNAVVPMSPQDELLASFRDVTRKRTAGDGTEPVGPSTNTLEQSGAVEQQPSYPTIADADDQQAFRAIDQLCKSQDRLRKNRYAIDLYHSWLDANVAFGRLDKVPNQNVWIAKLPPGVTGERSAAVPNKASDL